jgi:hypothetical protein
MCNQQHKIACGLAKENFRSIVNHLKKQFTTHTHMWLHLVQSVVTCYVHLLETLDGSHINDFKEEVFSISGHCALMVSNLTL